ncbi:MAG: signal peptidase I [Staphylococcus epidermidis]|nr:signal peptidase I [Staphylococcus epidermidis]
MSLSQLEEWFDAFRQFGYIPGFIMLYLRAIVPVLPLTLYVVLLIHAYGLFPGIIISWLGIVSGTFTVFLICKKFVNTIRMKKLKSRKSVQRLISFIDRQGLIPLFVLLCFPFTPNTLINIIASLSHIKIKYYFFLIKYLISFTFAIIIVIFIQSFIIVGAVISNNSMTPTLQTGDRVIVNKIKVTFDLIQRGDIIMYRHNNKTYFSRIIGKPGESVSIKSQRINIDDRQVNEPYMKDRHIKDITLREIKNSDGDTIPSGAFFVLNDNNNKHTDSRTYGLIDKKDIIGDVSLKYYPFKEFNYQFK